MTEKEARQKIQEAQTGELRARLALAAVVHGSEFTRRGEALDVNASGAPIREVRDILKAWISETSLELRKFGRDDLADQLRLTDEETVDTREDLLEAYRSRTDLLTPPPTVGDTRVERDESV